MTTVLALVVLVILLAGAWAALATLFTPPLTSGWREGLDATFRRWGKLIVILGPVGAALAVGWLLVSWLLGEHG